MALPALPSALWSLVASLEQPQSFDITSPYPEFPFSVVHRGFVEANRTHLIFMALSKASPHQGSVAPRSSYCPESLLWLVMTGSGELLWSIKAFIHFHCPWGL